MAIYYFLAVECGLKEIDSVNLCNYFKDKTFSLTDGTIISLNSANLQDETGNWWAEILPDKVSYGSPMGSDYRLVDYFIGEITQQLYALLKNAPYFRYALAGFELELFLLYKDLKECLNDGCYEGMILSKELWKEFGS